MSQESGGEPRRIDAFFSTPAARAYRWRELRAYRWRELADLARSWVSGTADRAAFRAAYNEAAIIGEFHAYPGPQLMAALRQRAEADDASGTAVLAWRISAALLSRSFPQHAADWDARPGLWRRCGGTQAPETGCVGAAGHAGSR
jgi:arginine decarboxylase